MEETGVAGFRTSPQQRAAWQQPHARVQITADLEGPLELDRLSAAVVTVRRRHEILRTRVLQLPGHAAPVQVIDENCDGLDDVLQDAQLDTVCAREWQSADGTRIVLVRKDVGMSALVLTGPTTLVDVPSLRRVFREVAQAYAGTELAPAGIQYADFAAWHNDLLDDATRDARRRYWNHHVDPALTVPAAELIPGQESADWRCIEQPLDGVVEHDVVAAAWAIMLWRLCGERDLLVTTTVSGRDRPELADAIGPYERDIPVVCRFDPADSFNAALATMRGALDEALTNLDDLDPARLPYGVIPGFEAVDDAAMTGTPPYDRRSWAPFVLRSVSTADSRVLRLAYDPAQLTDAAAGTLLDRLLVMLSGLIETPDAPIENVSMLLPGEAESLLRQGDGPQARSAGGSDLAEVIAEQARRTPEAIAIQDGQWRFTYAQLDAMTSSYAARLAEHGVAPGGRVVLWLPRGCTFVVAALAVMKAGAAYIPVDIRQPARRFAVIVDDAQPILAIVGQGTPSLEDIGIPTFEIDLDDPATGEGAPPISGDDGRLAYIMYTSGSTGRPNGVPITHRSLLNYLLWAADAYRLHEGTGSVAHTSVGFDLTVTTIWAPLVVGQRVRLVEESAGLDALVSVMRSELDITLLKVTPSQLNALLDVVGSQELTRRVRTLVLGGEALRGEAIAALRGITPMRIVNEYGPTETVVGCCAHVVGDATLDMGPVPIGQAVAGTHIYVLNGLAKPVPDGVPGEIYVGGVGVASGYVGRPELTAARFVGDPAVADGFVYRTGDRGRRVGGELFFEGRLDDQLKVLGVRIEPGEVEALLREHPAVADAAVIGWRPEGAESPVGLAALIVAAPGQPAPLPGQLAPYCRERLPDYLVPMVFASASMLPLTGNGKLDQRAVVAAVTAHANVQTPFVPARSPIEEILASAISAVLGRERVGIDDNYFAIGGDSIRSVMVASRAQARGVALSVADLHRLPTVRELAKSINDSEVVAEPHTEPFSLISAEDRALMPPDVEDAFPLNLLQEGMIFHRDFAAKSAVYHAIASVRLRAPFDLDAMRHVIHELVGRHPMLRTSFDQTTFSRPLQLVHRAFADPLGFEDLRGRGESEQQERIEAFVHSEKERGFELEDYPLIRFRVHRLDDETFQFTYGFHHEIVDGWSEALMVTELFGHYLSVVFGEPEVPSPPRSTMRDAVALELEALQRKENYEFWSDYLADATLMGLPRVDSGPKADKGAREIVRIAVPVSAELSDGLKRLALARTVPLKSVLLAAHMAVMNRYHGHNDTLTYTVTNGRPETADGSTAIGLFVNSLALRVRMDGGTWDDLILQTLDSERRSLPYRRLPMAELKRHQGNEPLAETLFFFTDYHVFRELDRWRARGVEHVASELYGESTFPFCAIFRLNRDTGLLEVRIEYDSLQFSAELMDRIGAAYGRVLEQIVADPRRPYHPVELLSPEEEREVERLGQGEPAQSDVACIHEAFARQAEGNPDAVALVSGEGTLTYAALAHWAEAIAARLRACGAGPERTVGVLAERSPEAVAAILGILQSGAAYLPLDPGQPDDRLSAILADARPVIVLAQPAHRQRVTSVPVEVLDTAPPPRAPKLRAVRLVADNLAYVIYTSGSTGKPKGVAVTHRNLVNSTLARTIAYPQQPDRYLLLSPLVFDSSVAGLFWPLCTGGTLHLPAEGAQLEPGELLDIAQREQITHTLCVPSLLAALLERDRPESLRAMGTLIVAGEASPTELLVALRRDLPGCTLYNEYGPTENTVWSTVWTGDPPEERSQLPIGRPAPGTRTYVLNPHLTRVPLGVAAQLHLAGAGVARGYLGDPARTAERFVPDPFAITPGERMYRSGDLARYDGAGELEFLGRMDKQVKIRGFRVELGEIEGILDTHTDVHRCVVVAREAGSGEKSLIAYVVPRLGSIVDGPALQQYLRGRVPKYMVPAAVSVLDKLPLTRTGKVDRNALPEVQIGAAARSDLAPPTTETEQVIAAIWCQALDRELVGVHDAFFDIGGESLRAMQVVTKANKVFGLELSVRALFDTPTVAAFAQLVDQARIASTMDTPD